MEHLINLIFKPPPMPPVQLPLAARMIPGFKQSLKEAFELAYHRGVYDGLVAGILLTLLFLPSVLRRTNRSGHR